MNSAPLTTETTTGPPSLVEHPQYAWEVATLFPQQGDWSEGEYLNLTDGTNRLIEFTDGKLEFLPMPTESHQDFVAYLYRVLYDFVKQRKLGKVQFAGLRVRVRPDKIREPDILFLKKENFHVRSDRVWDGADLVMEVVSDDPKDRERDYETKLLDYAEAGIPEYWIVDPEQRLVSIYQLQDAKYALHGQYREGEQAASALLPEFSVDVAELFAAADEIPE